MAKPNLEFGSMQHKQAALTVKKALEEDPTVFQYDEHYDEMDKKRTLKREEAKGSRAPKYIQNLMKTAERRQRENERRIEKAAQKELEKEGDFFKDKESFVTGAYKRKMEELRKLEEEEKREDALDEMADVSKQKDLSGFYRHLYRQTLPDDHGGKLEGGAVKTKERRRDDHDDFKRRDERRRRSKERRASLRSPVKETSRREGSTAENVVTQAPPEAVKLGEHPIWKKRTVGEALAAALERYFQRK
ncbi:Nuclear speckle splicing regulatory protein 1 [Orchesella cincta]|uniref:Nuclear speckle splicing regulatory protein 1 n=1 Tax=Orchesella cincta TaxID=48709 RepID=A0A1D2M995_ORCCI|nr:Nuclear speckle splicing regulatory protein 1 [Orchesella cincta]